MKYSGSIQINKPIDLVTRLFADPDNLRHYQDGFVKKVPLSGTPGETGAVSKMHYLNRGREMVLTETIINNQLPDSFAATYSHPMMDNILRTSFSVISIDQTLYEIDVEYTAINGIIPKLMAFLMPGMFTKQGKVWMDNFKQFVEAQ